MGFTRIATFEADQDPTSTTTRLVSIQKYLEPASINPSDMIAFDYQNGLLDYSSQLLVTENGGNTTVDVISKQKNTYQFREVQISSGASDLGQVSQNNGWVLVKLANLNEASSVFPAVVETEGLTVPDISTPSKGFAQVFEIEYDNYFNVTKYRDKGEVSVSGYTDLLVETVEVNEVLTYTQYNMCDINAFDIVSSTSEYTTYVVYCDDPSFDPVYFNIFTGADNSCVNDLGYDELPCTTEVTPFVTLHTKEVTKTVDITERQWNYSFNGERIAVMTYHDPVSADGRTNVLESHKIYTTSEHPSNLKRNSETVLTANGKSVATYRTQLNSAGDWAEVDCSYDPTYGNITRVTYPENNIGQRASNTYIYDNTVHQFIEGVSNQFNESICNTYDYGTGLLLRQVGINGHAMQYTYDPFDRLADVWAPRELSTAGSAPTVSYEYVLNQTVPVAVTYHNTASNSTAQFTPNSSGCTVEILSGRPTISSIPTHVKTATFVDGSGKAVQVKTENSEYNPSTSQNETNILVSGIEQLNQFGQPIQIWAGFKDNTTAFTTISTSDCDLPNGECLVMRNANYDYLHRQIATETWQADNDNSIGVWTTTSTSYGWNHAPASIGSLYGEKTTVFGQNGASSIQTGKYLDKRGQIIAQVKFGSTDDVTSFTYTQLGELSTVEDALNQITTYTYDMAGRTLTENHPDRGLVTNTYDKSSNLISMNRASIGAISFRYSYNRLLSRTMPGSSGNDLYDVVYTYGTPGDGKNGAGRIVAIDQGQGFKVDHYSYDELGQRVVEQSTIQVPQVGQRTYQTEFKYSSFGRILQASYPDGDVVNYHYTDKGELFSIESTAPGEPKLFVVQETQYNGFGQIGTLIYGNGTKTTYNYASSDFVTSGLGHLNKTALFTSTVEGKATLGGATTSLASRDYQYSNLGMVSSLNKSIHSSLAAGITSLDYSFSYDDKGRLQGSTLATGGMNIYELTMGYNEVGGITSKDSDLPNGGQPLVNPNLEYDLSYSYNPAKPHQLLSVTEVGPNGGITNFSYDDVGNLTESFGPSGTEELIWNELQQLSGVMNGNGIHHYVYDHNGERIMKSSINRSWVQVNDQNVDDIQYLEPYTLYVNPYYVVTSFHNGDHISKHYYMNTQRVATDISINYQGPPPPIAPGAPMSSDSAQSTGMGISASFEDDLNEVLQQFDAGDLSSSLSENGVAMEKYYPNAASESESMNRILYWYHPDYLGSVDLVTDRNGVAYEFFLYTPWGEDMYSNNSGTSNFTSPYRFNGKEKDPETGYHYYGARYYQSKFSIWMSVDPLAHETLEPYVYTGNNPVMLVDPDGNDVILTGSLSSLTFTTLSKSAIAQGVKLSINSNGELSYVFSGNKSKLSPSMQTLLRGIDNSSLFVQIHSTESNKTSENTRSWGGAFLGGKYDRSSGNFTALQEINPEFLNAVDNVRGTTGVLVLHEATEAIVGAEEGQRLQKNVPSATPSNDRTVYNYAHNSNQVEPQIDNISLYTRNSEIVITGMTVIISEVIDRNGKAVYQVSDVFNKPKCKITY